MSSLLRIAGPVEHEIAKIKGSRFVAFATPVRDEDEAAAFVDGLRRRFHDARHHCWAWRLGREPERARSSDDGEPSGTGGAPILAEIDGRDLRDLVVVVVRWFGGVKLGTGPLARAYGEAAREVLTRARVVEVPIVRQVRVIHAWDDSGPVQAVQARFGLTPVEGAYEAEVRLVFAVPTARAEAFARAVTDASSGRARVEIGPELA
ncbi:MAG: YigZ family protein [Planctomycetota bacterium]